MCVRRSRQLSWLGWSLLAAPVWCAAAQVALPATMEVDLVFPRNDTYAPSPHMPIVFAIQNAELAAPLNPTFFFEFIKYGTNNSVGFNGELDTQNANFSSSDPYFVPASTSRLSNTDAEGTWVLLWDLSTMNCSRDTWSGDVPTRGYRRQSNSVVFTIKNGAQLPDLVAATSGDPDTCAKTKGFAFNVTDIVSPYPEGRNSCAILSPNPPPATQPCGVKIDAAASSSIAATLETARCKGLPRPADCPAPSGALQFQVDGAAWFMSVFSLMYYLL